MHGGQSVHIHPCPAIRSSHPKIMAYVNIAEPEVFRPAVLFVNQLVPESIFIHIFLQVLHHQAISFEDALTVRIVFRKVEKQFCHTNSHPAIATSPIEGHIGRMIKETILTLNLIQIKHHSLAARLMYFLSPVT